MNIKITMDVDFVLNIPAPFDAKPLYTIELPNKYSVEIYQTSVFCEEDRKWANGWEARFSKPDGKLVSAYQNWIPLKIQAWIEDKARFAAKAQEGIEDSSSMIKYRRPFI